MNFNKVREISFLNFSYLCDRVQSTLVISTSVISNNPLSQRENLVLVLTQKSKIRLQNIVEKSFSTIFSIYIFD